MAASGSKMDGAAWFPQSDCQVSEDSQQYSLEGIMNIDEHGDDAGIHGAIQKELEQQGLSPEEVQIKGFEDSDFDENL